MVSIISGDANKIQAAGDMTPVPSNNNGSTDAADKHKAAAVVVPETDSNTTNKIDEDTDSNKIDRSDSNVLLQQLRQLSEEVKQTITSSDNNNIENGSDIKTEIPIASDNHDNSPLKDDTNGAADVSADFIVPADKADEVIASIVKLVDSRGEEPPDESDIILRTFNTPKQTDNAAQDIQNRSSSDHVSLFKKTIHAVSAGISKHKRGRKPEKSDIKQYNNKSGGSEPVIHPKNRHSDIITGTHAPQSVAAEDITDSVQTGKVLDAEKALNLSDKTSAAYSTDASDNFDVVNIKTELSAHPEPEPVKPSQVKSTHKHRRRSILRFFGATGTLQKSEHGVYEPGFAQIIREKKSTLILFCISVLLLIIFCMASFVQLRYLFTERSLTLSLPEYSEKLLCRSSLSRRGQLVYDAIADAAAEHADSTVILPFSCSYDEYSAALKAVCIENPVLFAIKPEGCKLSSGRHKTRIMLTYTADKDECASMLAEMDAAAADMITSLPEDIIKAGGEPLAAALHDMLPVPISAEAAPALASTAYAALVTSRPDAVGLALGFKYLLECVGISCSVVSGSTVGTSESHVWNMIYTDGSWSHVDVSWDKLKLGHTPILNFHSYFAVPTSLITETHRPAFSDLIPQAETEQSYYTARALSLSPENAAESLFKLVSEAVAVYESYIEVFSADMDKSELRSMILSAIETVNSAYSNPMLAQGVRFYTAAGRGDYIIQLFYLDDYSHDYTHRTE